MRAMLLINQRFSNRGSRTSRGPRRTARRSARPSYEILKCPVLLERLTFLITFSAMQESDHLFYLADCCCWWVLTFFEELPSGSLYHHRPCPVDDCYSECQSSPSGRQDLFPCNWSLLVPLTLTHLRFRFCSLSCRPNWYRAFYRCTVLQSWQKCSSLSQLTPHWTSRCSSTLIRHCLICGHWQLISFQTM